MAEDSDLARLDAAVPANVRAVCERLQGAGHQALTVGGAVRDALLGRAPGDWDVASSALPDDVLDLFPHTIPTGLQHGTVTIVTGRGAHTHVEVTAFRGEGAYTDARRPDHVRFGVPLVEDLARRDLRVNAMAYDPIKRELVDPFRGRDDLRARVLRAVGPTGDVYDDAVARFTEDGLRVMRAVRFAAQLEFTLDPDTERGIPPALPSLAKVSRERVAEELRKILGARRPSLALAIAVRTGIIAQVLPEVPGDPAWLRDVDAAPPKYRLGMMLARAFPSPDVRQVNRAAVGPAGDILKRLKFSNDEIAAATLAISSVWACTAEAWTPREVRWLLSRVPWSEIDDLIELWKAMSASPDLIAAAEEIRSRDHAVSAGQLAVTGKDLMDGLGIKPGPVIGRLLAALLPRVLDDPALNTREQLLELARAELPKLG